MGFPIRKSEDQSLFAAPPGLSQRTTSFIASQRQGIHQIPLLHLIKPHHRCPTRHEHRRSARLATDLGPARRLNRKTFASEHVRGDARSSSSPPSPAPHRPLRSGRGRGLLRPVRLGRIGMLSHAARPDRQVGHIHSSRCRTTRRAVSLRRCAGPGVPGGEFLCADERGRSRPDRTVAHLTAEAVVEQDGIEPTTSCLQSTRSPN